MCIAVKYTWNNRIICTYFHERDARLPVKKRNHNWGFYPWGRQQKSAGNLPLGGWASLEAIHQGNWDAFFPKPVKLPVSAFMEKDIEECKHWFPIVTGQYLQGLCARYDNEHRVYIVTIKPHDDNNPFTRWPKVIFCNDSE